MIRATEFEVKGKVYRLRYDFNALADMESKSGQSVTSMFAEENMGFNTFRLLLWAGLKWEDRGLTVERAGLLINEMLEEGYDFDSLGELIEDAFNESGLIDGDVESKEVNPTKAGSGKKQKNSKK